MGVLVLGMHRSGTSAITAAVAALGVPLGMADDRMPAHDENAEGFHESAGLSAFNELLMRRLGGQWDAPPALPRGWHRHPDLADDRAQAHALFAAVHPTPTWVWKDPRLSVLLPFWREVLSGDLRVVLMVRNPLAVARSLQRRNRLSKTYSLALWERYTRSALAAVQGLPVLVLNYTALMNDANALPEVAAALAGFAAAEVAAPVADPTAAVAGVVKTALRHNQFNDERLAADVEVTAQQRELYRAVASMAGVHERFAVPPTTAETPRLDVRFSDHSTCTPPECSHETLRIDIPWRAPASFLSLAAR